MYTHNCSIRVASYRNRSTGSAVYVYAVLPPGPPLRKEGASTTTLVFLIDDIFAGEFTSSPVPNYMYHTLVYANPSLPLGPHKITILNGKPNGTDSLFILDRIIYRYYSSLLIRSWSYISLSATVSLLTMSKMVARRLRVVPSRQEQSLA